MPGFSENISLSPPALDGLRQVSPALPVPGLPTSYSRNRRLLKSLEWGSSRELSDRSKLLFDPEQLVVFGDTIDSGRRARLDLTGICGDGEICDERVVGFTRPV